MVSARCFNILPPFRHYVAARFMVLLRERYPCPALRNGAGPIPRWRFGATQIRRECETWTISSRPR